MNSIDSLKSGMLIDGYQLIRELGRGGMGCVYLASKAEKTFALKFQLLQSLEGLARFEREAQTVAQIDQHPHIARVYQLNSSSKIPYIVFEYIHGDNLESLIKIGELTSQERIVIAKQLLSGLIYMHERGIIHRDIKPSNVMLTRNTPGFELGIRAVWVDFGLAQVELSDRLTMTGEVLGTPVFASPEQCQGQALTEQSDLFSFGLLLFNLFSGRRAVTGSGSIEIMNKIMSGRFEKTLDSVDDELRPIQQLIDQCLLIDRNSRPSSASQVQAIFDSRVAASQRQQKHIKLAMLIGLLVVTIGTTLALISYQNKKNAARKAAKLSKLVLNLQSQYQKAQILAAIETLSSEGQTPKPIEFKIQSKVKALSNTQLQAIAHGDYAAPELTTQYDFLTSIDFETHSSLINAVLEQDFAGALKELNQQKIDARHSKYKLLLSTLLNIYAQTPFKSHDTVDLRQFHTLALKSKGVEQAIADAEFRISATKFLTECSNQDDYFSSSSPALNSFARSLKSSELRSKQFRRHLSFVLKFQASSRRKRAELFLKLVKAPQEFLRFLPQFIRDFQEDCNPKHLLNYDILLELMNIAKRDILSGKSDSSRGTLFFVRSHATLIRAGKAQPIADTDLPQRQIDNCIVFARTEYWSEKREGHSSYYLGAEFRYPTREFCLDLFEINRPPIFTFFSQFRTIFNSSTAKPNIDDVHGQLWYCIVNSDDRTLPTAEQRKQSVLLLEKILADNPQLGARVRAFGLLRLARVYLYMEEFSRVLKVTSKILELGYPAMPEVYRLRCLAQLGNDDYEGAKYSAEQCETWTKFLGRSIQRPKTLKQLGPAYLDVRLPDGTQSQTASAELIPVICWVQVYGRDEPAKALKQVVRAFNILNVIQSPTADLFSNYHAMLQCYVACVRRTMKTSVAAIEASLKLIKNIPHKYRSRDNFVDKLQSDLEKELKDLKSKPK